ncbi:MAG: hypothetical protein HQ519_19295 [Planctomycetes bacterium]|nr:hypothetical protein [Planctomycetota bacterium]
MFLSSAALLILGCVQAPQAPKGLPINPWLQGYLLSSSTKVETEALKELSPNNNHLGQQFSVQVKASGNFHIDLRSYYFDADLILRDSEGKILAENDDGWIHTHSRLENLNLESGKTYQLWICSAHGDTGAFEVICRPGSPIRLTPKEQAIKLIEDRFKAIEVLESNEGADSPRLAGPLRTLVFYLWRNCRSKEAVPIAERAVAHSKLINGEKHAETTFAVLLAPFTEGARGDLVGLPELVHAF